MKWRIWLLSLGLTLGCVLIFTFAATQVYYNSAIDDSKNYLRVYMNMYDEGYTSDDVGAAALSEKLGGARVTFLDGRGNVLADSLADGSADNHSDRQEVNDAILNGEGFAVRNSSTLGKNMVYYCKSFDGFLVRIAVFTDSDWKIFAKTLPTLAEFSIVLIAFSVILTVFATREVRIRLKELDGEKELTD